MYAGRSARSREKSWVLVPNLFEVLAQSLNLLLWDKLGQIRRGHGLGSKRWQRRRGGQRKSTLKTFDGA